VSTYTYDAVGNQLSVTDPLGRTTSYAYDALDRQVSMTDALGAVTQYAYDAVGNPLSTTDALGRTTTSTYDALNREVQQTDPSGAVTQYTYDAVGRLTAVTDPNLNTTAYAYDNLDRLVQMTDPLGNSAFYTYDAVGNQLSATDRDGRLRTFTYDALNRQTGETWWAGSTAVNTIAYAYDAVGNTLSAGDNHSHYAYTYDALDRRTSEDNAGTPGLPHVVFTYTYDALGNRTSVADNQGVSVASTYDARNLLASQTWHPSAGGNSVTVSYQYDAAGQRTGIDRTMPPPVGPAVDVSTAFSYDAAGQLTEIRHGVSGDSNPLADYLYVHDLAGQLVSETLHGQTTTYTYDQTGQLTAAHHTGQADEAYSYDSNGNRTSGGSVVGANNQILSDDTYTYTYDADGNLVRRTVIATGEYTTYEYDYRNRLVSATVYSAGGIVLREESFTYDVFDRLIARTVDADGAGPQAAVTIYTVYDGDNAWADYDSAGNVLARYLYGDGSDEILARYRPQDGVAFYLTDHLEAVRDLVDAGGVLLNHIDYDSFGNIVAQTNPAAGDRFTFTGREWDPTLGLYYYRARFYDPRLGRFISEDPTGFSAGDDNLYRYVGNDPLNRMDPSGHDAISEWAVELAQKALLKIGCHYAEKWARGETIDPWADLQSLVNNFDLPTFLNQLVNDAQGAILDLVNLGGLAGLDLDPAALLDQFRDDPGGLIEELIGFNPVAFVDNLQNDPWAALEQLTKFVSEGGLGSSFGSGPAFQLIVNAVNLTQMVLPALAAVDKAPEIFALLDTYVTGGFNNWKSFFVNFLCGSVNTEMVPVAAGAAIAGQNDPLLKGLSSFDLFMQVGGIFDLRAGQHITSASASGSTFMGTVGCPLCSLEGRAPSAGSVARAVMAQAADLFGVGGHTTGTEHCFAPGVQVRLLSGETRNIEAVAVGDVVLAWDPATGAVAGKPVVRLFRNTSDHYRVLQLHAADDRPQEIRTTDGHPFRVAGKGWVLAGDLRPGDRLVQADGACATLAASACEPHAERVPIFNFEVEDSHTYFVSQTASDEPVLVHNASNPRSARNRRKPCDKDPCDRARFQTFQPLGTSAPGILFPSFGGLRPGQQRFYRQLVHLPKDDLGNPFDFYRVNSVIANLALRHGTDAKGSRPLARYIGRGRKYGDPTNDDAGHVLGKQFGGLGGKKAGNIVPQNANVNQTHQVDEQLRRWVLRGKRVCVVIKPIYNSRTQTLRDGTVVPSLRPNAIVYHRWLDRKRLRPVRLGNP
jgi:RHS repeat-associated protein